MKQFRCLGPAPARPAPSLAQERGIRSALVQRALREALLHGRGAVLLVGDAAY